MGFYAKNIKRPKNREKLLLLIAGEWIARAIYVATKLQIADHLEGGSKSVQELAILSRSHDNFYTGFVCFSLRSLAIREILFQLPCKPMTLRISLTVALETSIIFWVPS